MDSLEGAVQQAEEARLAGDFAGAVRVAKAEAGLSQDEIATTPAGELSDVMRLWRIWELSLLSLSQKELGGKRAVKFLKEARAVVKQYYDDPTAWEAAKAMKTDASGNEYQMAAEMWRDEGKLYLYMYHVSGNPEHLQMAINSYDEAITMSESGTSAYALAVMEKEMLKREQGGEVDFEKFSAAYKSAAELSPKAGGYDRLATISWWYTREALLAGKSEEVWVGVTNLVKASKAGKQNPLKFLAKDLARPVMDKVKQLTVSEKVKQTLK